MDSQTKVFRAHRALAWFYGLVGVGMTVAVSVGASQRVPPAIFGMLAIFAGIFAVHYFTARACKAGKKAGRVASIVIACLMLAGFPVGTLIGVYLLANTWRPWPVIRHDA